MKKYRSRPLKARRLRSDDSWDEDFNLMEKTITVYETEAEWQSIGILDSDGQPIEVFSGGMGPIGFVHFGEPSEEDE
jgi:hypothetical protein